MRTSTDTLEDIYSFFVLLGVVLGVIFSGCVSSYATKREFREEAFKRGFMTKVVDISGKEVYLWKQSEKTIEKE